MTQSTGDIPSDADLLRAVLESITDGLVVIDRHWSIVRLNGHAGELLDAPAPSLQGRPLWDALPALRGTALEAPLRHAMTGGGTAVVELYYPPRQRWLEVRAFPAAPGLTCMLRDIDRRKRDERALRDSSTRLQVAMAAGKLGEWTWDAAGGQLTLGERAADIVELPVATPVTWAMLQRRMLPEDRARARQAFLDAYATHSDFNIECRIARRDGSRRWLSVVGHGNYSDGGRLLGMTGMLQDITDRRAAEEVLKDSEEELRALADSIPQLAWIAQADGTMLWFNRRWYEYTGLTPGELHGDNWREVYAPECVPAMLEQWQAATASGKPFEMEIPIRGADGHYRWFLTRANPVRSGERMLRWFGTSTDVDQVKRAQEALRDESALLEQLNITGNALARHRDLKPLLQEVTDAATGVSGARFGAFFYDIDHGSDELTLYTLSGQPPPAYGNLKRAHGAALFGPSLRGTAITRCDDLLQQPECMPALDQRHGSQLRSYLAAPVNSRDGNVIGILLFGHPEPHRFGARTERIIGGIAAQAGVAIDNARLNEAARRAAEERIALLASERNARAEAERTSQMKDEFLATLSHELRTPLTAILGWSQVLRRGGRGEADVLKGLETIERNARAQAQLIEDLLDMSRIMSGQVMLTMQAVAPGMVADAAIGSVQAAANAKNIRIVRDYRPCGLVAADPARLQQVLWNLLSNAIKFTPAEGEVCVAITESAGHAEIVVADSGIGIGAEFLAHVFERFRQADASSTRRHGGLGLGLSIVKHLVEQHGGTVAVASGGTGNGATFTVSLPLTARLPAGERLPRVAPALPEDITPATAGGGIRDLDKLRVLVVDDEQDTRELIKRVLSDCNADITTAASAADALAQLLEQPVDLLISDIGMPEMDGFELLAQLRARGPAAGGDVPAIALTAFARMEDRLRALAAGFTDHLAKPVEPAELVAAAALAVTRRRD